MTQIYRYSGNVYQPAAGTTTFALTSSEGNAIEYLQKAHITVSESTDNGDTWTDLARPGAWDFNAEGTAVVLTSGTEEGDWIRIKRNTPYQDRFTTFAESSLLTSSQLNTGEDFSMYVDQELSDAIDTGDQGALKYQGSIDLTADDAPANPLFGDVYINVGSGDTIQGGDPGWVGIVGDEVSGGEQVVYQADATWTILTTPASQVGVLEVTGTAPITVDNADEQRPVVGFNGDGSSITEGINLGYTAAADQGTVTNTAGDDAVIPYATADNAGLLNEAATPGSGTVQYAREVTDAGVASWATVDIPPGTIVDDTEPTDPGDGQLWYRTSNSTLWVWDDDGDTWHPAMEPLPTGGGDDYANGVINQKAIFENVATIDEDYTISDNHNALSAGPITIADGTTVTVGDDESWVIVGSNDGTDPAGFWERDDETLSPANDGDDLDGIGSITAAGRIEAGALGTGNGSRVEPAGIMQVRNDSDSPVQSFAVYKGGASAGDITCEVKNDGTATFAGTASNPGVALNRSGSAFRQGAIDTYGAGITGNNSLLRVRSDDGGGGTVQFNLSAKGNATFRGTVTDDQTRSNSIEILLDPENPANYVSTTNSETGETESVYSGPVINVKEVLLTLQAKIQTLEAKLAALSGPSTTDIQEEN